MDSRGELVGALMTRPDDEVFAITSGGGVIRTRAGEVKLSGRQTMGVRLMNLGPGDSVVAIARNAESLEVAESLEESDDGNGEAGLPEVEAGLPEVEAEPSEAEAGPPEGQGNDMTDGDV